MTNAYGFGEENVAGSLEPGKRADFVILSDDPRSIPAADIRDITVLQTVIGGETVFKLETK